MKRLAIPLFVAALLLPGAARADDKSDCIAAFDSGQALKAQGKLTESIQQFAVCARDLCPRAMQRMCVDESTEASGLLPTVVLSAKDAGGHDVDAKVSMDGVVVATVLEGKAIPMNPGRHTFRFEREGLAAVELQAVVKEGQKGQSVSLQFAPAEGPATVAPPPGVATAATPGATTVGSPPGSRGAPWTNTRWAGVGVGSAGLAGIVVGSVVGSMSFSKWSQAQAECTSPATCGSGSAAQGSKATATTDATVSTTAFVAGGALVAAGVVMFLVSPSTSGTASAWVAPAPGGMLVGGRFW